MELLIAYPLTILLWLAAAFGICFGYFWLGSRLGELFKDNCKCKEK